MEKTKKRKEKNEFGKQRIIARHNEKAEGQDRICKAKIPTNAVTQGDDTNDCVTAIYEHRSISACEWMKAKPANQITCTE